VDAVDFALYRCLARDGLARFWASRRMIDPRVTARELAEKVGLSEAGVRSRLRALRRAGFLRGSSVSVNPSLFGTTLSVAEVPVSTPREADRMFRDLAVVDGLVFARDLMDEEDRKLTVYFVSETPAATARRTSLLRRLAPGGLVRGPRPYWIPPCERAMTPLDWKLLRVFRERPDASSSEIAAAAGLSLKTTTRRIGPLLDSRACWWSHSSDSDEWPLALLQLSVRSEAAALAAGREAAARGEGWIPVAADGLGVPPGAGTRSVAGLVPVTTPSALEATVRRMLAIDGVEDVHRTFGLRSAVFPQWVDEQIASRSALRA